MPVVMVGMLALREAFEYFELLCMTALTLQLRCERCKRVASLGPPRPKDRAWPLEPYGVTDQRDSLPRVLPPVASFHHFHLAHLSFRDGAGGKFAGEVDATITFASVLRQVTSTSDWSPRLTRSAERLGFAG